MLFPGSGAKLLLLCEKYDHVKQKILNMGVEGIPYGKGVTKEYVESNLTSSPAAKDIYNHFDNYTHYHHTPVVVESINDAIRDVNLQGNTHPFKFPVWDSGLKMLLMIH